jgi:hypothetical protein
MCSKAYIASERFLLPERERPQFSPLSPNPNRLETAEVSVSSYTDEFRIFSAETPKPRN